MKITENTELCCGCMACKQVCPCHAIDETRNENGFLVPIIDKRKCIQCKRCQRVCPANSLGKVFPVTDQCVYGAWLKSDKARDESQSGGAFTAFAEVVLKNNGIVYGAELECEHFISRYARVASISELHRLKGSKYVQAYTGDIFSKVYMDLQEGRIVLFGGTACDID